MSDSVTSAVEDYAKAIYALESHSGTAVSTNAVAERLGVTPGSASAMVKKLAERGLVDHEPYKGVTLTPEGMRLALEVVRHHRLLELEVGQRGRFVRVSDSDPAMLRHLADHGIDLGADLEIVDKQPFDGPVFARVGDAVHPLGGALAKAMRVELHGEGDGPA